MLSAVWCVVFNVRVVLAEKGRVERGRSETARHEVHTRQRKVEVG
jgi:hypothetical protein